MGSRCSSTRSTSAPAPGEGQRIELGGTTSGPIRITITATTRPQPPIGEAIGGVGFAEIDLGLGATTEFVRTPLDTNALTESAAQVDIVLTRLRTEPADRWRDDPEAHLARVVEVSAPLTVDPAVTLRLDRRLDDARLATLLDEPVVASTHLTGVPATRGAAAFDDDPATAWTTRFDTGVGERVTYSGSGTASSVTIVQPGGDYSPITAVRITDREGSFDLPVGPGAGSEVTTNLPRQLDLTEVTIEIIEVEPRTVANRRFNEPTQLPAAIAEVRFDGRSPAVQPVERLTASCSDAFVTVDGAPIEIGFDTATADALAGRPIPAEVCSGPIELDAGTHTVVSTPGAETGFDVDRVVLSTSAPSASADRAPSAIDPTEPVVIESSARRRVLDVPPCPDGCWVILGEGYNDAWQATANGSDLGAPTLIDGNANGWWLEPTTEATRVEITWPVQRSLNIAFALDCAGRTRMSRPRRARSSP